MIAAVSTYLKARGYTVNDKARAIIDTCDDWYRVRKTKAHERTTVNGAHYVMERMGFGQSAAADDARLCEVVEINAGSENSAQFEYINGVFADNRFNTQFRKQLEMTSAEGTSACYVRLEDGDVMTDGTIKGGRIRLNYTDALGFIPLTVDNDEVLEAAFFGEELHGGKERTTLVLCTRGKNKKYRYEVVVFDDAGNKIAESIVELGEVKPFAVMRTAAVNVLDDMQGYGYPKLHGVIPILKGLDAAFTALMGDIDTAEKITIINELLCEFDEETGKPKSPSEQMKRRFVQTHEKLPSDAPLIHEITPEIRIDKFRETIELLLSLLSQQFGFGTKKYSFDKEAGTVTTATEYIGERQDMLQELNRQRQEAKEYIAGIVRAVLWFANTYQGGHWDENVDVLVEFDDSYITNKAEELESIRQDVVAGIGGAHVRKLYLMQKYNLDEEEAAKWAMAEDADAGTETED